MALIDEINAGTPRQTVITFPDGDHEDIMSGFKSGSIELEEILCDGESLLFGGCASNMFSCHLVSDDILGKKIKVYQKIGEYTEDIFTGYVDSLSETNERTYHELIAYDEINRHGADNVAEWYNNLWTTKETYTLKEFRDSFFAYIGITQVNTQLVNDGMTVTKTISGESIPAIDIMKAICEINGVFGNINRQGLFDYVSLSNFAVEFEYKSANSTFETYSCEPITRVRVIEDTDDVGAVVGEEGNTYTVCGNILTYGTSAEERTEIASKLFSKIVGLPYRPADMQAIISNPSIRLGDRLALDVNGKETQTYVLKNRLYGVQLFSQRIEAEGVPVYSETDIDVNSEIQRIKSKQLKITKTVEEFKTEVVDGVREAKSVAKQTADKMEWIVEGEDKSSFEMTDEAIEATTKKLMITTSDGKTVLIEGGKMFIDEIFAQAITATGSIAGAKLIGAYIESECGKIGGFTMSDTALYNGTSSMDSTENGVYLGTDGLKTASDYGNVKHQGWYSQYERRPEKDAGSMTIVGPGGIGVYGYTYGNASTERSLKFYCDDEFCGGIDDRGLIDKDGTPIIEYDGSAILKYLNVSKTLMLPDEIWSDAKTHVAMITSSGELTTSTINSTELYRLLGVTSNVQDQFNAITKAMAIGYENSGNKTVSLTSGTASTVASVTVGAGTWLIVGGIRYTPGSGAPLSTTELSISTGTTMNTNPTNYVKQQESGLSNGTAALNATTIVTVSADTTYNLLGRVYTSGSSNPTTALGRIFAVKIPKM